MKNGLSIGFVGAGCAMIAVSACGMTEVSKAVLKGWQTVCVDGVTYLQFPAGVSVKYKLEGEHASLVACQ